MLTWSAILFAAAAAGGATMLVMRMQEKEISLGLAVGHGLLAATGLVLLALVVLGGGAGTPATVALVLFAGAALGGFVLFASHLKSGSFSTSLALVHGLVAVAAFVVLLVGMLG